MPIRLLLYLYPWLELWTLIELGVTHGAMTALMWVLSAMLVGGYLLRSAGQVAVQHLLQAQREGQLSKRVLAADLSLAVSAVLLMVPGLVSDAVALLMLIRFAWFRFTGLLDGGAGKPHEDPGSVGGEVIEGEYQTVSEADASLTSRLEPSKQREKASSER